VRRCSGALQGVPADERQSGRALPQSKKVPPESGTANGDVLWSRTPGHHARSDRRNPPGPADVWKKSGGYRLRRPDAATFIRQSPPHQAHASRWRSMSHGGQWHDLLSPSMSPGSQPHVLLSPSMCPVGQWQDLLSPSMSPVGQRQDLLSPSMSPAGRWHA
jgi:hypothetical protein